MSAVDRAEKEALAAREAVAQATLRMNAITAGERDPGADLEGGSATFRETPKAASSGGNGNGNGDDEKEEKEDKLKVKKELNDPFADGMEAYLKRSIHELLFTSQLNWLLLTTPLAMFQVAVGGSDVDFPVLARAKRPPFALL